MIGRVHRMKKRIYYKKSILRKNKKPILEITHIAHNITENRSNIAIY